VAGGQAGWRWGVPAVAALTGLLFVTAARTAHGTDLRAERHTELADLVIAHEERGVEQVAERSGLRSEVATLLAATRDVEASRWVEEGKALGLGVGMDPASGPGVTVTLDDAPVPPDGIPAQLHPDDYLVHQQDVQSVVNALWAGGAEAVAVMDQRLVATSAVRCVGNTLILQGRVYAPPFTVTAVGPVDQLRQSLESDPQVTAYRQWVDLVGLGYEVAERREVTVPGYDGALDLRYAEPVP
jgi:uncharacterized protein YlxW (UPF0749 family)